MKLTPRFLALALGAALLAGCAGAPPPLPIPPVAHAAWSANDPAIQTGNIRLDWWRDFGSAELDRLVAQALAANHDLAVADANLRAARALAGEARRARGVQGGAGAGVQRLRESSQAQPPVFITPEPFGDQTIATLGVDFAWEIDLAGGSAATARAAGSDAEAMLWERRQTEAAVAAQVVRAWLDLARAERLAGVLRQRLAAMDRMLAVGAKRTRSGAALAADFAPLERLRAETEGELPLFDHAARNAIRRIAVLTGEDPVAFAARGLGTEPRALVTPAALTVHDPRTLLRLRPDVQIAEARLIAAFERAGASRAALYPSLSLGAGASLLGSPAALDEAGALRFSIGPSVNWGIFNLGQVRARIRAADASSEAAAAQWQRSLLVALEEADGAIDAWRSTRRAAASAHKARQAAEQSAATMRARARAGAASAFELAQAEGDLLTAEVGVITAEANQREAWANTHLALGAGWGIR